MEKIIKNLNVDKMIYGGKAENNTSFEKKVQLDRGILGQKVDAKIVKRNKNYLKARVINIIEKSPLETKFTCNNFNICGGCSILSIPYDKQLELKKEMLIDLFQKNNHKEFSNLEIVKSPINKGYKNKMEFSFGDEVKNGPMTLGLHKKNSFMSIVTTDDCHIIDEDYRKILKATLNFFKRKNIPHYNSKTHEGILRHLVIRKGFNTKEILINLVTVSDYRFDTNEYKDMILSQELDSKISGILHTLNDSLADDVRSDDMKILYGNDFFYEEILGKKFKISPFSFFQTNSLAAEVMYQTAIDMINGKKNIIFDLYSGTGTIGIIASEKANKIYSIEIVEEAVHMARENARMNSKENIDFIAGDVKEEVEKIEDIPDLIILDPPRAGMTPKALIDVINFNSSEILYISCNPKKFAEELTIFKENGYKVINKKAFDMFPNTNIIEMVVLMKRA